IGVWLSKHRKPGTILFACLASSLLFFTVTNFGTWLAGGLYTKDFSGLIACYTAAIPFYRNTLLGDLLFTGLLFGLEHLSLRLPKHIFQSQV
ncbi:MAG: hypothetical protein HY400_05720, partial [Elusimicrobia bacterium]|nr:hypothetical protein [Elusimicrobiota bacterium]